MQETETGFRRTTVEEELSALVKANQPQIKQTKTGVQAPEIFRQKLQDYMPTLAADQGAQSVGPDPT